MIDLYNAGTDQLIGSITRRELRFLDRVLEKESSGDHRTFIDRATIDLLANHGAPDRLLRVLRAAVANGDGVETDFRHRITEVKSSAVQPPVLRGPKEGMWNITGIIGLAGGAVMVLIEGQSYRTDAVVVFAILVVTVVGGYLATQRRSTKEEARGVAVVALGTAVALGVAIARAQAGMALQNMILLFQLAFFLVVCLVILAFMGRALVEGRRPMTMKAWAAGIGLAVLALILLKTITSGFSDADASNRRDRERSLRAQPPPLPAEREPPAR